MKHAGDSGRVEAMDATLGTKGTPRSSMCTVVHPLGALSVVMAVVALAVTVATAVATARANVQARGLYGHGLFELPSEQWPPSAGVYLALGLVSCGVGLVALGSGLYAALRKGCRWAGGAAVLVALAIAPLALAVYLLAGGAA